ncbi:RHS repeat-associated core domain-containing protein [Diaphorobacter aerolatus]|uniref:RHS repeat-associated core domain-containing protein n=1 Tax=Diaphorobacter aerolatus TaxID=1288495 RepID=UPI001D02D679|nr:RHS repeat-associated core domain-containing protein [Diaphorobacter aerolatus]
MTRYAYDVRGRLTEAINDGGSRTTLAYDLLSQVVEEARTGQGLAHRLQHQYDALGNRTQTALPDGRRINWLYYGSGHLHQINIDGRIISDMERDGLHREIRRTQGQLQSRYGYDAVGRLTAQATWHASPSDGDALNAGAARPGAWQALGDEIDPQAGAQRSIPAEALVLGRRYQYDLAGNLQTIHDSRNGATQYRYDRIGRILAAMQPQLDERFAFDPAHNMLPVSGRQGEAGGSNGFIKDNRLEVFEDKRFSYDTHGNLIEKKIGKHTVMRFEWDVEHQLQSAKVTKAAHTGKPVQTQTNYRYDAFGRRLEKQGIFASTLFEWDGNRLLAEQKGSQQTLYLYEADSFAPLAQVCVEDRASAQENPAELRAIQSGALNEGDEADWQPRQTRQAFEEDMRNALRVTAGQTGQSRPAAMAANDEKEAHDPSGLPVPQADKVVRLEDWKVRYYHNDHLGTPRELSGEQGNALWSATYQAWGNTLRVVQERATEIVQYRADPLDERVEQNLRFQGQYFDEETGLHYNRFRYYDPDVGRFVSQDPIGLLGAQNLYIYPTNPTGWIDPLGLVGCWGNCF